MDNNNIRFCRLKPYAFKGPHTSSSLLFRVNKQTPYAVNIQVIGGDKMIRYDRLWETMKEKGVSQYALIKKYGISPAQITRLKRNESVKVKSEVMKDGYSLIPLKLYFKGNYAKILLGLCKGKKLRKKVKK